MVQTKNVRASLFQERIELTQKCAILHVIYDTKIVSEEKVLVESYL